MMVKSERGAVLTLVLILLVVGALILTPLLGLMSTGLLAGQLYERKTDELYAADAGIEDVCWQLMQLDHDPAKTPASPSDPPVTYHLGPLNDKEVEVTVDMVSGTTGYGVYKVTSTATGSNDAATTVVSYVQTTPDLWNNAITSTAEVRLEPNSEIYGNVMGDVTVDKGDVYGGVRGPYDEDKWPFGGDFRSFYWPQVSGHAIPGVECCGGSCTLDVSDNTTLGVYELGFGFHDASTEKMIIKSTGDNITVVLTGPIYIKGDDARLDIGGGGQPFYLDLNYQTIYVEGRNYDLDQPNKKALYIPPGKVTLKGSGAILAEGNIDFQPNIEVASGDEFIFVMSLYGSVNIQPGGTMYGSVAGRDIEVFPGTVVTQTEAPVDPDTGEQLLGIPFDVLACSVKILTWEINP